MAARIIEDDERLEEETETIQQESNEQLLESDEATATEPPQDSEEQESEVPEKYQGKSLEDVVRMHQEAEKLLGRQSSEVGELRRTVDSYIQTQLSAQQQAPEPEQEDVDFFTDPEQAVARAIENHPKIKEAEAVNQQYRQQNALQQLNAKHPDMKTILADDKFASWIQASKIRTQLFVQADQQFDHEAADELFTLWKDRQGTVEKTAQAEKAGRKAAVKEASTGNARGSGESSKKIYRRSDIIKLMKTDPQRYEELSDEIMQAYSDGRVK